MGRFSAALFVAALGSAGLCSDEPQDRADLPVTLKTWYRVLQGDKPSGYFHETLKRSASPWGYEYLLEGEFEIRIRGQAHEEDWSLEAMLDDVLSPGKLELRSNAGGQEFSLISYVSKENRHLEIRPPGARDPVSRVVPAADAFHAVPTLTLLALRQNETLTKPGRVTLRVADLSGKEASGVEVTLEAGEAVRRSYLGREVSALPVTFVKPFPAACRESEWRSAYVDRYGRLLEAVMAGGARIVIARDQASAVQGLSGLYRHGRRDPFDAQEAFRYADRERAATNGGDALPTPPRITLDSLSSDLSDVRTLLGSLRQEKSAGNLEEARALYLRALVSLRSIRDLAGRHRPALLPEVDQVRDDVELAWGGASRLRAEAAEIFKSAVDQMERLEAVSLEKSRERLAAYGKRIEVEGRPEREEIEAWTLQVGGLLAKCRTRLALAQARLALSGITIGEAPTRQTVDARWHLFGVSVGAVQEVAVVRPVAMAEINGRLYREGDTVEGTQIRIDRIGRLSVTCTLRDECREVGLHP